MLETLIEAVKGQVRVTCANAGHIGRFAFEPHIIYTDPIVKQTLVAGYYCGPLDSPANIRRWTEFATKDLTDIRRSQIQFSADEDSRDHVRQVFGITHLVAK